LPARVVRFAIINHLYVACLPEIAVLTRRLSLKLLAPTVLVSLLLVATCGAGALYVNHLHFDLARAYSENVASTLAAQKLEGLLHDMVDLLRDERLTPKQRERRLRERTGQVLEQIEAVVRLANFDRERELVTEIGAGFGAYQERREQIAGSGRPAELELSLLLEQQVLPACAALIQFNTDQVSASEASAQLVLTRLKWGLLAAGIGAPLGGLWIGYAMARHLYQSLSQLSVRIRDAAGRLNRELDFTLPGVKLEDPDDLHDLHRQMQGVVEQIEKVVARLQQSERAVLRSEQLAAVGQVAAGVAHELRNPLTSVKMLVQAGLEGPHPTGLQVEDLRLIEHEIRRMEACIQTFLDFARPPSAERRRCDLLAVVRRALTLVEGRARRQKVACVPDLPATPVMVDIDAEQIHQVLLNLLLNALDALPLGGQIDIEVLPARIPHPFVTVRVQDNGPGIPAPIRDRLFEPFVSGKETGLGLGLSICQRLVEAHGGTITAQNPPGGGAVFTFTIPT
jgi:signal transduction histidine kinase